MRFICTTEVGLEAIAEAHVNDLDGIVGKVEFGIAGLVIVDSDRPDARDALAEIPELNNIIPTQVECASELAAIAEAASIYISDNTPKGTSISLRVRRRGQHPFSSIDMTAAIAGRVEREVNLQAPHYELRVETVRERTYLGLEKIDEEQAPPQRSATRITAKLGVVQLLYADRPAISESMGHRIGRAAQAFSIRELILAYAGEAEADHVASFCRGACKGRDSRLNKVRRIRGESSRQVPIKVADLYQTVRRLRSHPMIVTSAAGKPIVECRDEIRQLLTESSRLYLFIGSRQGVPRGVFRDANLLVNLAPGLTFATEHGIPAAVAGIMACLDLSETNLD